MSALLPGFWQRLYADVDPRPIRRRLRGLPEDEDAQQSGAIFLVLRRMRVPLIVLIVIYAVSVLGLTLIPGQDAQGKPWQMGFFHAFYFMSYTATTIGFGELPYAFTDAQRMWVTLSIYLTVIGWAYAVGSLLALLQDRAFRAELGAQRFARRVARLRAPFYLIAGYGQTGRMLARSLDALGTRFVIVDRDDSRIDAAQLHDYREDTLAWTVDAANPHQLRRAGLDNPKCAGVFALTSDDEANLAAAMAVRLIRPDLPVLAATLSRDVAARMRAVGVAHVVNPFDRFGDFLALALRAPSTLRVIEWLTGIPGTELPANREPPRGRWVCCGHGRFGTEVVADLAREGLDVAIIDPDAPSDRRADVFVGQGTEPEVLHAAGIERAVGLVAGTDRDTSNLSIVAAARAINPGLFIVARQNRREDAPLFVSMKVDFLLQPAEVVAHECLARLTTPHLTRFFDAVRMHDDAWSARLVESMTQACGRRVPHLWNLALDEREAPALARWLAVRGRSLALGDLMRDPLQRDTPLQAVALLVLRGAEAFHVPALDFALCAGDEILFAGRRQAQHRLQDTLHRDATRDYVLLGRHVPQGWLWQWLTGQRPA
jgi:voltage-gated potassium channel